MNEDTSAWGFGTSLLVFCIISFLAAATVWWGLPGTDNMTSTMSASSPSMTDNSTSVANPFLPQARPGPSNTLGSTSDAAIWRQIRSGQIDGQSSTSGFMIQTQGTRWLDLRNQILPRFGGWLLFGMLALVSLFFVLRGRINISAGRSGDWIPRMSFIERLSHWIMAASFILLALTGLNMLYGRSLVLPLVDPALFATLLSWGKYIHNYVAFAFMFTLALNFLLWIKDNFPTWTDVKWILKGGGMFGSGHPAAGRFNAGEKGVFWIIMLGGLMVSLTGLELLWPFSYSLFETLSPYLNPVLGVLSSGFIWLNTTLGVSFFPADITLATQWTPMAEQQTAQIWHAVIGFGLMAVIIGHIYIGTVGMEGALDGMSKGKVDSNWAREHHSLWADKMIQKSDKDRSTGTHPAE